MDFSAFASPWLFATIVGVLTLLGCVTALKASISVSGERGKLNAAKIRLTAEEAWNDAYSYDRVAFSKWMRQNGIEPDSHLSDYVRSCWSGWFSGRAISLSELHQLVSRRERSRSTSRISGGIAALLLVIGILGTLICIHPVLKAFQLTTNESGEFEEISQDTELVNSMVNNLGDAFLPSLSALLGTVLIVSFRGAYGYQLNRFVLELDSFAIDFLIPKFRPPTIPDQFRDVKAIFVDLSDEIAEREDGFEKVVNQLEALVKKISPAVDSLATASKTSQESADTLSSRSKSISSGITRHLGKNSPMYKAVVGFEDLFSRTEESIERLTTLVAEQGEGNRADREDLSAAITSLQKTVSQILLDHENARKLSQEATEDLRNEVEDLPKQINAKATDAVEAGIKAIEEQLRQLKEDQKKEGDEMVKQIRDDLLVKIEEISDSAAILPDQIGKLQKVLEDSREITDENIATIRSQSNLAEKSITKSLKSFDGVSESLDRAASSLENKLSKAIDRMEGSIAPPPLPNAVVEEVNKPLSNTLSSDHGGIEPKAESTTVPLDRYPGNEDKGKASEGALPRQGEEASASKSDELTDAEGADREDPLTEKDGKKFSRFFKKER